VKPEERDLVAQLCASRAGLKVDPDKVYLLESRLGPVARREGFGSIPEMLQALRTRREDRLIWAVVESMTTGETAFFRDKASFELFSEEVLPALARMREGESVRVWSAACGPGQEVYSLAMTVDEQRGRFPGARIELFASDISERALEKAQSGLYTQFEVQRGLPIRSLVRHFDKLDEMWALSPRLRQMVRWRRANLAGDISTVGRFDVIFCRYFLGNLVEPIRPRVLEKLALALEPGGFLFLGEDEDASGLTEAFQPVQGRPGLYAPNPAFRAAA
jgi:chemotaxis protein methyltransferase CheR